jgi:AAA domain
MLTIRLQIQAIADRLAGFPIQVSSKDFVPPWLHCLQALEAAQPGEEQEALARALAGLPNQTDLLQKILAARPGYRPTIPSLADIASELQPIEWVWRGWIPRGLITVLGASQGSGKSFVATDLAYRIIHNKGFPDGTLIARPGANIIYVDAEMVPQILNQRAECYGLDRSKLFVMLPEIGEMLDLGLPRYQDHLAEMVALLNPELIIIDSLSSVHSGGQNNVEDVRSFLGYLIRLTSWAKCGLVLIHHIRKPSSGQQRMMNFDLGIEDLSGSGYITQQARVVLGLRVVQTGPEFDPNGPRELKVLKTNLGPYHDPLGFEFAPLHPAGVMLKWDTTAPKTYREPTQLDECKEWLEDFLKSKPEGIKVKEVIEAAIQQGISHAMIYRAKRELRAHIQNTEGRKSPLNRWKWSEDRTTETDPDDS